MSHQPTQDERDLPQRVRRALEAFESGFLDQIIRAKRPEDFEALRSLVVTDAPGLDRYRRRAIYALGRWGNPEAADDIVRVMPRLDETGRIAALDALGRLGTESARDAIASYGEDPSSQVRKFVVRSLGRVGGPEATERLREIARTDPNGWIRELAQKALEQPDRS